MHSLRSCVFLIVATLILITASTGLRAQSCAISGAAIYMLTVTAAEVAGADRTLSVHVGANGCTLVHRPLHYREAGDYSVQLSTAELAGLADKASASTRALDGAALSALVERGESVRAEARRREREQTLQRGDAVPPELAEFQRFQVLDADRYVLETRIDAKATQLEWHGLLSYAEHYPEISALQELAALTQALQSLATHSQATRVPGAGR